jgi:cold shock CspA family protein
MRGRVESFDEHRGDGRVRVDDGATLYFHCVNIADGSRRIAVGERVAARRGVGHLGHDEAVDIVKEKDEPLAAAAD